MRITIIDGLDNYKNCQLNIVSWFCEQNNIKFKTASVIELTQLAIKLKHKDQEVWIPKSLIKVRHIPHGLMEWI